MNPLFHPAWRAALHPIARPALLLAAPLLLLGAGLLPAAPEATPAAPAAPIGRAEANAAYEHGIQLAAAAQASGGSMDEAVKELTIAANAGHPFAITTLARMYRLGEGVPKNEAHADNLITHIELINDPVVLFQAGLSYLPKVNNQPPIEKNVDRALGYLLRAAQQGYGPALGPLGYCFLAASPEKQDLVAAFQWLSLAATQGDETARMYLERVRPRLTNAQTAEALQRLNALRSRSETGRGGGTPPTATPVAPAQ